MDGAYLVFRWLVGRLVGFLWGILQWAAVLSAWAMVIMKYALHLKPSTSQFIQQVTPGALIFVWWMYRMAAEHYQKAQIWYWWGRPL
jgi:hypothetical protein